MRRTGIVCAWVLVGMATACGVAASELDGTWEGSASDGSTIVWQMQAGRVRIDGRPADLEIRADSLLVLFDAPVQAKAGAAREAAVYRFLLGGSQRNPARLFVYGFDLGSQGLSLLRTEAPTPPPEDAAPPLPPSNGATNRAPVHAGPVPGVQARTNER
jgi:hypothetical protein